MVSGFRCQQALIGGFRDYGIEELKDSEIKSLEYLESLNS
jgi:hypothetical protein